MRATGLFRGMGYKYYLLTPVSLLVLGEAWAARTCKFRVER